MGDRRRQRDGRPGAVPVGKARAGDRTLTAGSDRQANGTPGPAGLLGTGRDRRDGNRCGRSDRRSYRIADHVQPAAADRRDHHRGGLAAAADDPGSARSTFVRARHHRLAAGDCHRLHRQFLRRDTTPQCGPRRFGTALSGNRERSFGRGDHGGDRHAARRLPAFRSRARPARASRSGPSAAPAAARHPLGCRPGDADSRRGKRRDAAGCR